jgi:hypothetical protein
MAIIDIMMMTMAMAMVEGKSRTQCSALLAPLPRLVFFAGICSTKSSHTVLSFIQSTR